MKKSLDARFGLITALILGAAAMRIIPHPPNFTPVAALALFGGARFDRKLWAFGVPLAAMLLSDSLLELLTGRGFHSGMYAVYASFAAVVGLGLWLHRHGGAVNTGLAALAASGLFFLTTNFAVWLQLPPLYPRTGAGLLACYTAAIPFFGPTLAGDLLYTTVLFGAFALAERRFSVLAPAPAEH
jgi:hypothetical protein